MDEDLINLRERFNQIAGGGNNGGKPGDGNDGGFTGGACAIEPQNPNIGFTDQVINQFSFFFNLSFIKHYSILFLFFSHLFTNKIYS